MSQSFERHFPHPLVHALDAEPRAAVFANPKLAQTWLQQSQYGEFKRSIAWLNARHLDVPPERHNFALGDMAVVNTGAVTEDDTDMPLYIAPSAVLRTEILHNTWSAMRRMQDVTAAAKLGCVVLAEGQFFINANKRTARSVYQLGTQGYSGTEQDVCDYTTAAYNDNPDTYIDFSGMHNALAGSLSSATANTIANMAATDDLPQKIEPVSPGAGSPYLMPAVTKVVEYFLSEPHFSVSLAITYLSLNRRMRRNDYLTPDGNKISANAILRDMNEAEARDLFDLNDNNKLHYLDSIIAGFADGEQDIYGEPIEEFIAPYMPLLWP